MLVSFPDGGHCSVGNRVFFISGLPAESTAVWFAGKMPRADSDAIIGSAAPCSFLVRESESNPGAFICVLNANGSVLHLPVKDESGGLCFPVRMREDGFHVRVRVAVDCFVCLCVCVSFVTVCHAGSRCGLRGPCWTATISSDLIDPHRMSVTSFPRCPR
jgi:hypothetical protein